MDVANNFCLLYIFLINFFLLYFFYYMTYARLEISFSSEARYLEDPRLGALL